MEPLISVIVPVYRVEKFLRNCVESIQHQTYSNFEIILVDDGSPDSCPFICDEFEKLDQRIKVIHKPNGGLSDARNAGMKIAKGEYFCFVDSDDYIAPTMLEHLMYAIVQKNTKMAISNFKIIDERGKSVVEENGNLIVDGCFSANELLPKLYQAFGWYYIVAWNKLYHRSLFEDIQFPVGKIHEDEYIVAQIIWKAQKIASISTEEYIYTYQRKGSIMNSRQVQSQCDWLEALYLRFQFAAPIVQLADFTRETRAVYFRELNNLYLDEKFRHGLTSEQKKIARVQYNHMNGKSKTEKINWILFKLNPRLEHWIVEYIRSKRS